MALSFEERRADYLKRQASGTLHRNPFEGLLDYTGGELAKTAGMVPEGYGLLADFVTEPVGRLASTAASNYSNAQAGQMAGLNQLPDGTQLASPDNSPEAMAARAAQFPGGVPDNSPEAMASRVRARTPLEEIVPTGERKPEPSTPEAALAKATAPNPGEPENEATVRGAMITAAAASKKAGGESSVNLTETLDDNPDASVGEVSLAYSLDLALGVKKSVGQDWDKQENSAWDNFTGMYDLATVGLNLMALSGGQGTLTQNLGIALSAGRAAKVEQEEQGLAAAAAARAEGREDAALRVTQAEAATKALNATSLAARRLDQGDTDARNATTNEANAVSRAIAAEARALAAKTGASSAKQAQPTKVQTDTVEALFKERDIKGLDPSIAPSVKSRTLELYAIYSGRAGERVPRREVFEMALSDAGLEKEGTFRNRVVSP
jgi:hypothetical protein